MCAMIPMFRTLSAWAILVHRLANPLAFERRCRGPVPGRVSSRDKGDPRRGGQARERARGRTGRTPPKQATSTAAAAPGGPPEERVRARARAAGGAGGNARARGGAHKARPPKNKALRGPDAARGSL